MEAHEPVQRALDLLATNAPTPPAMATLVGRWRARRRRRLALAGVAAVVFVAGISAFAVQGQGADRTVVSADDHGRAPTVDERPDPEPTCGPGSPAGLRTPESVRQGPAPGAPAAAPGQTVLHWTSSNGLIEVRWPADAKPLYGEVAAARSNHSISFNREPDGVHVRLRRAGNAAAEPELLFTDPDAGAEAGCDVVQLSYTAGTERVRLGLRFTADADAAEVVDVSPLITATVSGSTPPSSAVGCSNTIVASHSGVAGNVTPARSAAESLAAFLRTARTAATFPESGWTEFRLADDGQVIYGWETQPGSGDYAVIVVVEARPGGGWVPKSWMAAGC